MTTSVATGVFKVMRQEDEVEIEVRPGLAPKGKDVTQVEWDAYVVDAVRRWVNKDWRLESDGDRRIPF